MRKRLLHISIAFLTFLLGVGLTTTSDFNHNSTTSCGALPPHTLEAVKTTEEQKLLEIYNDYGPAKSRHDPEFFERVESEDYVLFLRDRTMTREQNIQLMESWPSGAFYEEHVKNIKVIGHTAVVTGWEHVRYPTGEVATLSFIDVCVRGGDEWKILSTTVIE